jgi:hypothetical protein
MDYFYRVREVHQWDEPYDCGYYRDTELEEADVQAETLHKKNKITYIVERVSFGECYLTEVTEEVIRYGK